MSKIVPLQRGIVPRLLILARQPHSCLYSTTVENEPDFNDTKKAFRSKSTKELLRSYFVFKAFSFKRIVDNSDKIIKTAKTVLGSRLFRGVMKSTVYGQFVAGEDLETLKPVTRRLMSLGVRPILDYAAEDDLSEKKEIYMEIRQTEKPLNPKAHNPTDPELHPQFTSSATSSDTVVKASARTYFYQDEQKCDENMRNFIKCINAAADASDGDGAFAAIKVTGLGRTEFLLRLSESLEGAKKVFHFLADGEKGEITIDSFLEGLEKMGISVSSSKADKLFRDLDIDKSGTVNVFEWFQHFKPSRELYQLLSVQKSSLNQPCLPVLDDDEKNHMRSVLDRAKALAERAAERGVRLMIDAEQTYYQPAIRHIAVNYLMPRYNQTAPVIYNTQQCYLRESEQSTLLDISAAETAGFHYGVKLVRGAYMEQERKLAVDKGYEDPIWNSKEKTDQNYNRVLERLLNKVSTGKCNIMVATHNEDTVKFALKKMSELGIPRKDGSVVFGQLLGMCDHVTFSLGSAGYLSYKYMPYGPVELAIPYLQRRANENKGMLQGAVRERALLARELKRRLFRTSS